MASDPAEASAPSAPAMAWRRLHPASLLVNLLPQAWRLLRGYWPLLLFLFIGSGVRGISLNDLVFLALFFAIATVRTVVHWATLGYRVRDERLEIRTGLLHRQVRLIGPERIQNAERIRNPLHRLAGLVEVRLETAGDAETEGLLSALTDEAAEDLLAELDRLRRAHGDLTSSAPDTSAPEAETLLALGPMEIIAHGLSSRRVGVLAVVAVVLMEISQQVGPSTSQQWAANLALPLLVGVVLAAMVVGWLLAVGNSFLRLHRFRVGRRDDSLVVEQGLLTRRRTELPIGRIQLLRVDEPLMRRLMGFATVHVETAAISVGPDGVRQAEATLPMVERERLGDVCRALVPELGADPWVEGLRPVPLRAMWWGQMNALRFTLTLTLMGAIVAGWWSVLALLLWPPLALTALLDWRWQAWQLRPDLVLARRGFWNRQTWILPTARVQSATRARGPMLRLYGLAEVQVKMAGSRVPLPPLLWNDAGQVLERVRPTTWHHSPQPDNTTTLDGSRLPSYPDEQASPDRTPEVGEASLSQQAE